MMWTHGEWDTLYSEIKESETKNTGKAFTLFENLIKYFDN